MSSDGIDYRARRSGVFVATFAQTNAGDLARSWICHPVPVRPAATWTHPSHRDAPAVRA